MSTQPLPSTPAPDERPMCQEHSDAVATGTCPRCGRFVCGECMDGGKVCPACLEQQLGSLPSSRGRAFWVSLFLGGYMLADTGSVLLSLVSIGTGGSDLLEIFHGLVGLGIAGTYFSAAIAFLVWQHLAVRQAEALSIDVGSTPGWAVGSWFIPFINLVKPYRIMRNVVGGLGGEALVESTGLGFWWGLWIAGNFLSQVEMRMSMRAGFDAPTPSTALVVGILASLASLGAAGLCLRMVRAVQRELDLRR